MRRAAIVIAIACALAACKRHRAPPVQEVWDEEPVPEAAEAIGNLAPPWPAPVRGQLDNGLLTFWLHEADTPALHLRLLVPTGGAKAPQTEAAAAIAEYLRWELTRRTKRFEAGVALVHAPDRIELAVAARGRDLGGILGAIGIVLAARAPSGLDAARDRLANSIDDDRADELATEAVLDALLGRGDRIDGGRLRALTRADLVDAWEQLSDPRDHVLIVHAGTTAEAAKTDLRRLASHWRGMGRRTLQSEAVARLRGDDPEPPKTRLLADPPAPLAVVREQAQGSPHLVIGRVIATPDARQRSLARVAQRVFQEEADVSIAIAGEHAVLLVHGSIGGKPEARLRELVDRMSTLATTRQPRQRLFQAVQLWLGARVVEASLAGEDWTALLSAAIDLAERDADVGAALARDAQQMLAVDAEALLRWTKTWLDPRRGTPGWVWAVAGASEADIRELGRATTTRNVGR